MMERAVRNSNVFVGISVVKPEHGQEVADAVDRRSSTDQGGCTRGRLRRRYARLPVAELFVGPGL